MKKIFSYILLLIIGFVCFTSDVFATFTVELQNSSGKTATYKVTSSIKYSKEYMSVTPVSGIQSATLTWNDDGLSGTLKVTFSSADCTGDLTINYKAEEGCADNKPKNCDAILSDARSMIGKIPYEYAAKCASTSFEECKFNTIWTDKYPTIPHVNSGQPAVGDNKAKNLSRHGDGKGHTGLDCSGFVWWIYNRNGINLLNQTGYAAAMNASVGNITGAGKVYSITKEQAKPCDLVTGSKPDAGSIPHIGIVSKVEGGMMFIHENSKDDNVVENCYFDCEAQSNGKAVKYWRVKALWDGTEQSDGTCNGKEPIHLDNSERCTCDTCDEIEIKEDYVDPTISEYNNCCKDGESHLREYRISQLFCSTTNAKLNIQYYDDQCNNDAYNDDTFDSLLSGNEFCRVYCTEDIQIKTPGPVESASGKFFKLAELEDYDLEGHQFTTKAPIVKGSKTCTIKTDYAKWRKNYVSNLKQEVETFNQQQENLAYYEMLRDPIRTEESIESEVSFKCTANNATEKEKTISNGTEYLDSNGVKQKCGSDQCTVAAYVGYGESYMDSSKNTTTCGSTVCREYEVKETNPSTKCTNKYYLYKVNTSNKKGSISCSNGKCSTAYYQVKIEGKTDTDNGSHFDGLKVVNAGTKNATYDEKTAHPTENGDGCTSVLDNFKNSQSGYTCEQTGSAKDIPDGLKKEKMDDVANRYKGDAGNNTTALSGFTGAAELLEKAMDKCQELFDKENDGYAAESTSAHESSEFYILNPTVKFKYMQVYLDNNERKDNWQEINYSTAKCQYTYSNSVGGVDDIDDKVIYYSNRFGDEIENMRDIKANSDRITTTDQLNDKLDNENNGVKLTKKFRRDAQYNALCTWTGEDIPSKITLYPGPQVQDSYVDAGTTLISEHTYQYALYLTTYKAEYETYWELGNLGGSTRTQEKFVKYFNSDKAHTCADYNPEPTKERDPVAYSNGDVEKEINPDSDTAKFTCVLNVKYGGMRIGSCQYGINYSLDEACEDNDVKSVFEFKVVDPKNMFPGDWSDKATNWKKDDGDFGPTWDDIQNKTAGADETYSPDKKTYSFKLDSTTIRAIKSYNKDHSYEDFNMQCTCPKDLYSEEERVDSTDCATIKKPASPECTTIISNKKKWKFTCRECQSNFLQELAVNNSVDGVRMKDGIWNNSKSFSDVRKDTHWA